MQVDEYRKLAETEDQMWYFRALNGRAVHWLDRLLSVGPVRLLDAGCGTGGFIRHVQTHRRSWEPTGLDFSPRACDLARTRTATTIVEGSITALPFGDKEFDAVVSLDVLCQVEDGAQALREFARCTKTGGAVLVNVPAFRWLWSYHDDTCETKHRYTRPELRTLFEAAGLEIEFATYANMLTLPLVVVRRKVFPPKNPTSDVQLYPAPIEWIFTGLAALEHLWTNRGLSLPVGSSVFVVARRR